MRRPSHRDVMLILSLQCALALSVTKRTHARGGAVGRAPVVAARGGGLGSALAPLGAEGGGGGHAAVGRGGAVKGFFLRRRTPLLFAALVAQKVSADVLTDATQRAGAYSGATVSMLSEIAKFPVLVGAIVVFGGGAKRLKPTVRRAIEDTPFKIAWIAAAYAAQNLLYFAALGRISAASYQVLSQSKLIFTAILAVTMLGQRLVAKQVVALGALLGGSVLVQLSEVGGAAARGGGGAEALLGGGLTVAGALLSAAPNVWYEKILKTDGEDEWARNVQVTFWIFAWLAATQFSASVRAFRALSAPAAAAAAAPWASPAAAARATFGSLDGITPAVWCVVALKSLNGILIPATLKYAGNLVYLYAKPTAIVATALATSLATRAPPSPKFALGAALVIWSMTAFQSAKKRDA